MTDPYTYQAPEQPKKKSSAKTKLMLVLAVVAGLGIATPQGRAALSKLIRHPKVQQAKDEAVSFAQDKGPVVQEAVGTAAAKVTEMAQDAAPVVQDAVVSAATKVAELAQEKAPVVQDAVGTAAAKVTSAARDAVSAASR
jgi:pantoate kinase